MVISTKTMEANNSNDIQAPQVEGGEQEALSRRAFVKRSSFATVASSALVGLIQTAGAGPSTTTGPATTTAQTTVGQVSTTLTKTLYISGSLTYTLETYLANPTAQQLLKLDCVAPQSGKPWENLYGTGGPETEGGWEAGKPEDFEDVDPDELVSCTSDVTMTVTQVTPVTSPPRYRLVVSGNVTVVKRVRRKKSQPEE